MDIVVQANQIKKSFKKGFIPKSVEVLKDVSFSVPKGKVTGFLGANGAGKTTTMKCMLGLNSLNGGGFQFFENLPLNREVKKRIGFLPERPYFYDYLTASEFLSFYGQLSQTMTKAQLKKRIVELLDLVGLSHTFDQKLRGFSKGMLQKIGLAQAIIHHPDFVILDEPMSGLDPDGRFAIKSIIQNIVQDGASVFFSSHLLHDVEALCDHLIILKKGKIVFEGDIQELFKNRGSQITITFSKNGKTMDKAVDSVEDSQVAIDQLRADQCHIISVSRADLTLEEAFSQIALRDEA